MKVNGLVSTVISCYRRLYTGTGPVDMTYTPRTRTLQMKSLGKMRAPDFLFLTTL
jgi:hypothetical protein